MTDESTAVVPVWALATGDTRLPALGLDGPMTAERLSELRGAMAALADQPIATLEVHPLPETLDRDEGIALDAASPLAQQLSQLVTQSARGSKAVSAASAADEVLYRMVVPKKFAAQLGQGLVKPMKSKAVVGGIRSQLMGAKGVVGGASFVPVAQASADGVGEAAGAAAVVAGGAGVAAGGAALTVAAPLVLMAVAVAASAAAEQERREAIEHITELLEQLVEQNLDEERSDLDGCRDAIDKATAVVLDEGKLGVSLGLDSAVHAIDTGLAKADRRLAKWQGVLNDLPEGDGVEVDILLESFPGIDSDGGLFHAHLELAALAIALKRRVIVLQAVEQAQEDAGNPLLNFVHALRTDQQRLDRLQSDIASVLVRLSALKLTRPRGLRAPVFSYGEVDRLMAAAHRIHALGDDVEVSNPDADVVIDVARIKDGSVIAFPARPA